MKTRFEIHPDFQQLQAQLLTKIERFQDEGEKIGNGNRNSIKGFSIAAHAINIKAFKKPHLVNKIVYKYFRKSKAERSYLHARTLLSKGILTPAPYGFLETYDALGLVNSYYLSNNLKFDLMYSDLVQDKDYPEHENILRAFTTFTWNLHEKNIYFKDHSSGNTLIVKDQDQYKFYLVDLNRMDFKPLNFDTRMKNFSRLTPHKEMVRIMSEEYAHLSNLLVQEVFQKMWFYTDQFQQKFFKKRAFKQKYFGKKY